MAIISKLAVAVAAASAPAASAARAWPQTDIGGVALASAHETSPQTAALDNTAAWTKAAEKISSQFPEETWSEAARKVAEDVPGEYDEETKKHMAALFELLKMPVNEKIAVMQAQVGARFFNLVRVYRNAESSPLDIEDAAHQFGNLVGTLFNSPLMGLGGAENPFADEVEATPEVDSAPEASQEEVSGEDGSEHGVEEVSRVEFLLQALEAMSGAMERFLDARAEAAEVEELDEEVHMEAANMLDEGTLSKWEPLLRGFFLGAAEGVAVDSDEERAELVQAVEDWLALVPDVVQQSALVLARNVVLARREAQEKPELNQQLCDEMAAMVEKQEVGDVSDLVGTEMLEKLPVEVADALKHPEEIKGKVVEGLKASVNSPQFSQGAVLFRAVQKTMAEVAQPFVGDVQFAKAA